MLRLEDPPLLRGHGQYTDDFYRENQLFMAIFRSPVAHANITKLNVEAAKLLPEVACVLTAHDTEITALKPMNCRAEITSTDGSSLHEADRPILASTRVKHLGEPLAAIFAESYAAACNAIDAIELEFESLPAVTDVEAAAANDVQLWPDIKSNRAFHWQKGNAEETEKLVTSADHVVKLTVKHPRVSIAPIEPRSCLAEYDSNNQTYTLHSPSQGVISLQRALCNFMQIDTEQLRVVTNDVGGSFALKIWPYAEQLLALTGARITNRAVKWTASRSESFLSDVMGRGRVDYAELALDNNGSFIAFRVRALADMGAYLNAVAPYVATSGAVRPFGQAYNIPGMHYSVDGIYTNTMTTDAYRGAGKPESACTLERLIDLAAAQLDIDPMEIRRRNLITPEDLPYNTPMAETYDAGDFPALADSLMINADWVNLASRKQQSRNNGMLRGAGVGFYLHATGGSTDERSEVCALPDGDILVRTGLQDNGQGHRTALAMVTAEALEIPVEKIRVEQGDTDWLKKGGGTGGSNLMAVAATTVHRASHVMLNKARTLAAELLDVAADSLEYNAGTFEQKNTDKQINLQQIALRSAGSNATAESGSQSIETGCAGVAEFEGTHTTFPTGACICEVEVDPDTGSVNIERYISIDDMGKIYNEATTRGQLHGGIAQAAGEVLMESMTYDDTGQLLSGTLLDYTLPRATDLPALDISLTQTDSPNSILGAKGVGELSAIGAPGPIHNAVIDALKPLGITHLDKPLTPLRIWNAINSATINKT